MPKHPTPDHEGWFWAKLVHPSDMPEGDDWRSVDWEIVQVVDNNGDPESGKEFAAQVGGVQPWQWLEDFVWGPEITEVYRG